jgi:diphosphomevalonate decarboxylase
VSEKEKDTSSTSGMETSKRTSELLAHRANGGIVDRRMEAIKSAYLAKDFAAFGEITMKDSNQFHATCLDTYPPIFYMNDTSHDIIRLVHVVNAHAGRVIAAYTFDAGPNAVIYTLQEHVPMLMAVFAKFFPCATSLLSDYCNKPSVFMDAETNFNDLVPSDFYTKLKSTGRPCRAGDVKYMFVTKPGSGPVEQPLEEAIIDSVTGEYKAPSPKHRRLKIGCGQQDEVSLVEPLPSAAFTACSAKGREGRELGGGRANRSNNSDGLSALLWVVGAVGAVALGCSVYLKKK